MAAGNSSAAVLKLNGRMVYDLLSFWRERVLPLWRERGRMGFFGAGQVATQRHTVRVISAPNIGLFDGIANPHRSNDESGRRPAQSGINLVISILYMDQSLPRSTRMSKITRTT